eukprot:scaffold7943_cov90-Isochrysis_galbana.AAC.1
MGDAARSWSAKASAGVCGLSFAWWARVSLTPGRRLDGARAPSPSHTVWLGVEYDRGFHSC